jgi:hypothetical protein
MPPRPRKGSQTLSRGEGSKKNPQPSHGRLGILPACTLHSPFLEDLSVKDIQAGFLTLGSSYFLRLPILSPEFVEGSKDSGLSQVSSPTTAAGPSPTFQLMWNHGVPFTWISPLKTDFI